MRSAWALPRTAPRLTAALDPEGFSAVFRAWAALLVLRLEIQGKKQIAAQNMTTLRYFALKIVRQESERKVGVANSRKRAGFDRN